MKSDDVPRTDRVTSDRKDAIRDDLADQNKSASEDLTEGARRAADESARTQGVQAIQIDEAETKEPTPRTSTSSGLTIPVQAATPQKSDTSQRPVASAEAQDQDGDPKLQASASDSQAASGQTAQFGREQSGSPVSDQGTSDQSAIDLKERSQSSLQTRVATLKRPEDQESRAPNPQSEAPTTTRADAPPLEPSRRSAANQSDTPVKPGVKLEDLQSQSNWAFNSESPEFRGNSQVDSVANRSRQDRSVEQRARVSEPPPPVTTFAAPRTIEPGPQVPSVTAQPSFTQISAQVLPAPAALQPDAPSRIDIAPGVTARVSGAASALAGAGVGRGVSAVQDSPRAQGETSAAQISGAPRVFASASARTLPVDAATAAAERTTSARGQNDAQLERVFAAQLERGVLAALNSPTSVVTLRLHPASLGQIRIQVAIDRAAVSAKFEASSTRARDALSRGVTGLKAALADRGLELADISVSTSAPFPEREYALPPLPVPERPIVDAGVPARSGNPRPVGVGTRFAEETAGDVDPRDGGAVALSTGASPRTGDARPFPRQGVDAPLVNTFA